MTLVRRLAKPILYSELLAGSAENPDYVGSAIERLYQRGIVSINGRSVALVKTCPKQFAPRFLALHLVSGCNFSCAYCYNASPVAGGQRMPLEVAQLALEKAASELDCSTVFVDFLGGEPLLAFDTIKQIVKIGRSLEQRHGKSFKFMLQTNGSLLSADVAKFLVAEKVGTGVSLDGPSAYHDRYRHNAKGLATHQLVVDNLTRARDLGLDASVLAVIYEPSQYVTAFDYFAGQLGITTMRFNLYSELGRGRQLSSQLPSYDYRQLAEGFLAMARRAYQWAKAQDQRLMVYDLCYMLKNLATTERAYMCMRSPCGIGRDILAVGPDGSVYACEEHDQYTSGSLRLGSLYEGSLASLGAGAGQVLERRVERIPKCAKCHWRAVCGGGCAHKALASFGQVLREDPRCQFFEHSIGELAWLLAQYPDMLGYLGA